MYDWDGCLVQSLNVWVNAYQTILEKAGIEATMTDIMSCLGNWNAAALLGHPDLEQANLEVIENVNQHITDAALYPNAREAIIDLKADYGMSVFIVTATKREIAESTKAFREIEPLIDFTVFGDDVTNHKPDPEAINLILDKFGLHKDEVLLVGDSAKDMEAAQNAGVDSVWFAPPTNKPFHAYEKIASLGPTLQIADHLEVIANCKRTLPAF